MVIIFRYDTIFSVARSISGMCLSFIWIFQSISCTNMMLSSCSPVQIYILLLCQTTWCFVTDISCKVFYWVHIQLSSLMILVKFLKKLICPIICMYFQFYPIYCYDILHILITYWVHFFHTIFYLWHMFCYIVFVFSNLHT